MNRVTSTEFWTYIGAVTGPSSITGTGAQSYSVLNSTGLSYSWSLVSGYQNVTISSGGNTNTVTLSPLHSGIAILRLTVSATCNGNVYVTTQQKSISIQTNICLEGTFRNNSSTTTNLNTSNTVAAGWVDCTVTCPNAASYTWQRTSGTLSYYSSGNFLSFNITSGASVTFNVIARNSSNVVLANRSIWFANYGSFAASPNPASTSLKIDALEEASISVTISNLTGKSVKEIRNYKGKESIDVSDFMDGEYVVKVFLEGKLVNEERIKIAH